MTTFTSKVAYLLFLISITLLAACGSNSSGTTTNNTATPSGSELLFIQKGCIACHTVQDGAPSEQAESSEQVGPSLVGVATRSEETIKHPDYTGSANTVETYFEESILKPEIYLVPNYEPLMPQTYEATINEQELTELINYMVTFK